MSSKLRVVKAAAKFPKDSSFDPPEHYTLRDRPGAPGRCAEFFAYWKRLAGTAAAPDPRADLIEARWYIHKPKVLLTLVRPERKNNCLKMLTGPLWFEEPDQYMTEVLKKMGSGSWHVVLNEAGVQGALAECYFESEDWDQYPPQIDLKTLVRNDPINDDYVNWLAAKGIKTPWDNPQQEEEEMQGELVKTLIDTVKEQAQSAQEAHKELTDIQIQQLREEADRAREEKEEAIEEAQQDAQTSANLELTAINKTLDILSVGATKAMDMVVKNAGSQLDTVSVMKTAFEFARREDTGIAMLVDTIKSQGQTMLQMQEKQNEFMQNLIGMKKQPDGSWSQSQVGQQAPSFAAQLTEVKNLAELLGFQRPGGAIIQQAEPPPPPRKSIWDAVAENPIPFMTGLSAILTLGANIVYNIFAAKGGGAVHPNEALQRAQAAPVANPQQPTQPQQQPASKDPKDPRNWAGLGQFLENSLRTHLLGKDQSLNGYSFAEHLLSEMNGGAPTLVGRQRYDAMRTHLGPVQFVNLICMHQPIMELRQNNEANFMRFIEEFFGYDEYMATQQQGAAA
jgi:hypothetical protein